MKKILSLVLVFVLVVSLSVTAFAADLPIPTDFSCITVENGNTFIGNIDTSNFTQIEKDFLQDFFDVMYRGKSSTSSYLGKFNTYGNNEVQFHFYKIDGPVKHYWMVDDAHPAGWNVGNYFHVPYGTSVSYIVLNCSKNSNVVSKQIFNSYSNITFNVSYPRIFFTKNFDITSSDSSLFLTYTGNIYFRGDNPDIFYTPEIQQKHNLTVNYKFEDGTQAAESVTAPYDVAAEYNVASPSIEGFTPSLAAVTGTMGAEDIAVDVTYIKNAVAYTLTINYNYADGTQAAEPHVSAHIANVPYSVASPIIEGFTPNSAVVAGRMGEADITTTVIYTKNNTGGGTGGDTTYNPFAPPSLDNWTGYNPFVPPSLDNWTENNPFSPPSLDNWNGYNPFINPFSGSYSGYNPFIFEGVKLWNTSFLTCQRLKKWPIQYIIT